MRASSCGQEGPEIKARNRWRSRRYGKVSQRRDRDEGAGITTEGVLGWALRACLDICREQRLELLSGTNECFGIRDECEENVQPESTTPTQVFCSVVQANRQLNLLLEKRFTPSDVFQQVTLAMNYGASLLARFPGATRIPKQPAFERGKRPDDVFKRLIECYELVRNIAQRSGVKMLDLNIDKTTIKGKTPSDVNDVASLIVSELAYLHTLLDNAEAPARVYYPGRKLPSHVFQRAGMLKAQLEELKRRMEKQPD